MNEFASMDRKPALHELISPAALEALSGSKAFQLGKDYMDDGAVRDLTVTADKIRARVEGTQAYRVVLSVESGEVAYGCSCPRAGDGYFCKHCVAVGLAWLASLGGAQLQIVPGAKKKRPDPWRDIQDYLCRQKTDVLVALVLDAARRDDRLYRSLLLKSERSAGGPDLARILRKEIDDATRTNGFVAWDEAGDLANTLHDIVDSLAELVQPATGGMLAELIEHAIARVETMLEDVDDSGGGMGDVIQRLGELHVAACRVSLPDPLTLAERLLRLEMSLAMGIWEFDPVDYREVLGDEGLNRYRELALAKWKAVAALDADAADEAGLMAIAPIMERLAKASGDIEQLVALKSRDLSSTYRYLEIAVLWHTAGKVEQALEWAERGLAAFPERADNRLRDFLAAIYLNRGRGEEALQLTWIQFKEQPRLENYQKLALVAGQIARWPEQRVRALSMIDTGIATAPGAFRQWGSQPGEPDYSLRVAVAMWEKDLEAAWDYANRGACRKELLLALAGELETSHLDDALGLYRRVVPGILEQTTNEAYAEAIKVVQRMAAALGAHQRHRDLAAYLGSLRVEFKRKRNFIKLLDQAKLGAAT
jgi:uncharacterized Zn finger protein